jgi:hypothetical protein
MMAAIRPVLLMALAWATVTAAHGQRLSLNQVHDARPYVRSPGATYRSFALEQYVNTVGHIFPYDGTPKVYYSSTGDYLTTGYDVYQWLETRQPGQTFGSAIFKANGEDNPSGTWNKVFDNLLVAKDGYGNWGYSAMAGDALIARFTPLTLSKTNFNGVRLDISTPYLKITTLASRTERPGTNFNYPPPWKGNGFQFADDSTMLMASRIVADLGQLQLAGNWVNQHVYNSLEPGGSNLKGTLRTDQPMMDHLIIRFSDDSPNDGIGGPIIDGLQLIIDGEPRPDMVPRVVRQQAGATEQVGSVSAATGRFRPAPYTSPAPGGAVDQGRFIGTSFYRDREIPLYSDFLTRLDHEEGIDVSKIANIPGLIRMEVHSPNEVLQANGVDQVAYIFDLTQEVSMLEVEAEALVGGDYKVDVALLTLVNPRGKTYNSQFNSTYYKTVARARGNPSDLSNLKKLRFHVGEDTGQFIYSADLSFTLPGLEVTGEYARSTLYSKFPAHVERTRAFKQAPRISDRGAAWYLNATHWFDRGSVGGEAFSINPDYSTELRTFLMWEDGINYTNLHGLVNSTFYWQTVDDNDDGDRYPDVRAGNLIGVPNDSRGTDLDGVLLGLDSDNDGTSELNRNLNSIPDVDEPFLMYNIEPRTYAYGFDRDNNDVPDYREDDGVVDYPYDPDQEGYHLFAQWALTQHWSLSAGLYQVDQIAGPGHNNSTYGLLNYRRDGIGRLRRIFFENHFRRVKDDIFDEFREVDDIPVRGSPFSQRGLVIGAFRPDTPPIFISRFQPDLVLYQDSYVNESYLEGHVKPLGGWDVVQKLRLRTNWQQGGRLGPQNFQRERRLDYWTWVSRVQYNWQVGRLKVTPQFKYMYLRLTDQERDADLLFETRSIPILRVEYPLLPRTFLRLGIQGLGSLPYRRHDRTSRLESFEQRTSFMTLTNTTRYFGYELITIFGVNKDQKKYDNKGQNFRNFDTWSVFARALVGFTEFGRLI